MSQAKPLSIDLAESFPALPKAPIVEAVLDLRARAETPWKEEALREHLTTRLPQYPDLQLQREVQFLATLGVEGISSPIRRDTWHGLRATSMDKCHVAQFHRDGFVFSRLAPYQDWEQFRDEALRLWRIFAEFVRPSEIQRVGMRFINRIPMPREGYCLREFLNAPPRPPENLELPVADYLHQETFDVPGYPYAARRIQSLQPPTPDKPDEVGLIVDIDIFTTQPHDLTPETLDQQLAEMRWLKDKVFFGSVTAKAIESFQGGVP